MIQPLYCDVMHDGKWIRCELVAIHDTWSVVRPINSDKTMQVLNKQLRITR